MHDLSKDIILGSGTIESMDVWGEGAMHLISNNMYGWYGLDGAALFCLYVPDLS